MGRYRRFHRGVPTGYQHSWFYKGRWNERKVGRGRWKFRFRATKTRGGSSKGGFRRGQRIVWRISGYQTATKIGGRTYLTDFQGTKTVIRTPRTRYRRHRRWY